MSPTATATRPSTQARTPDRTPGARPGRHRSLVTIGVLAVVVLLLATAGWLVYFSTVFSAQHVTVTGPRELKASQVQSAAQVPLDHPLVRQDLTAIAQRTAGLPQVAEVHVRRDWPTTIAITVVERQPVLAVAQPDGYAIVDKHGVAYETRRTIPKGVLRADVNPDNVKLLQDAGEVAAALPASLRNKITKLAAYDPDDITLTLESGVAVHWGGSADSALKAEITAAVLKRKPRVSIDVSSPHNPAFR